MKWVRRGRAAALTGAAALVLVGCGSGGSIDEETAENE